jgi:predicted dehydrogenase
MNAIPSDRNLRVGVIGTSSFAEICHIPGIRSHHRAEVVAVWGRRIEAAREMADKFGISKATDDLEALCADPEIDAVTIASANVVHAEQAICALRNGKHVFCEKPLAMSASEARAMADAARESGVIHQVAFTFRYNYGLRELRRRLAAGDIGTPFLARIQYDRWDALAADWKATWRDQKASAGAGILFDLGSHLFDITRHVLGPIGSVIGYTHVVPREAPDKVTGKMIRVETDDLVNAWMRLHNGLRGQFFISRVTPPFAELGYLEIVGEKGALKAALSRGGVDFLKASTPADPEWMDLPLPAEASDGKPHALGLMMHSFVDACLRGEVDESIDATFEDGLAAQLAMSALIESQASDRWVRLEDVL